MFKILFWLFVALIVALIMIVGFGLNSERFLNQAAKIGIEKSGLDIKYGKIKGGLYSGLEISDFDYQNGDVKADIKVDMDFTALQNGEVRIHDINLSHLRIDKEFLASLIQPSETNGSKKEGESFIQSVRVDNLHLDTQDIVYEGYTIEALSVDMKDFKTDLKAQFSGDIKANIKSNVAQASIDVNLQDSHYDAHIEAAVQRDFIATYLKDTNVTLEAVPPIMIDAKGDLEDVKINAQLGEGRLHFEDIMIAPKDIMITAAVGIKSGDIKANVTGDVDSDFAWVTLALDTTLNTNDVNETLKFDLKSDIKPNQKYVAGILKEHNASVKKMPHLAVDARGDLKNIHLQSHLSEGMVHFGEFEIAPKKLDLDAAIDVQKQDVDAKLISLIDSNVAHLDLQSALQVSVKDINHTLSYTSKGEIRAKKEYISSHIPDANVTLEKLSALTIMIKGDAKALDADFDLDGEVAYNDLQMQPSIKDSKLHFDFLTKALESQLHINATSNKGHLAMDADVSMDSDDINNTLAYKAALFLKDAKPFMGVNLAEIGDINIDAKGSLKALQAKVDAGKIKADVKSDDFDTFHFTLDTQKLYLGKIYAQIPADLNQSFAAMQGRGFYILSRKEAEIKAKLKGFKYQKHTLFSNEFSLKLKGEDMTLSPLILQSDKFKVTLDAKKEGEHIVANIKNRAFYAKAKLTLEPLNVHADGEINSIEALLKEVDRVYPVDTTMGVDGKVKFSVRMEGEKVRGDILSDKITLKEGRLEALHILALYAPGEVRIKNFDFHLAGFEGKGVNRPVKLAREGIITFEGEDASVDVELEDLLVFKGKKKADVTTGTLSTKTLALAYPEYGATKVTTNLEMFQSGGKTAVTGEVRFKETEVNYTSRFLDISKDSDIIIISKKDKKQKEQDDFLQNMFLDVKIISDDEILYKVDAGEIEMQPDMRIRKDFGKTQRITGKIKILGGMYDFADKRFTLEEGAVAFRGQKDVNPLLDLHVVYDEIDDVLIKIKVGGDKNRPKLAFSSEPQMSKKDIFSYLLFGMSASETEGAATSANKAAERIFGRAISKDLARELNLDRLDMNRNTDGGIDVKAGKKVKRGTIIYYQNRSTESSVIVERKLSKSWEVDAEVGKLGQSVDFVFRKGFK